MNLTNVSLVDAEKIDPHLNILVLPEGVTCQPDGGITIDQGIIMSINKNDYVCVTNVVRVTMTQVAVRIDSN